MIDGGFLLQFLESIKTMLEPLSPLTKVNQYDHALLMRWGVYKKTLKKGLNWKVPIADEVLECRNTITSLETDKQSLVSLDGKEVVISTTIRFKIVDPVKFLLDVERAKDVLKDAALGVIKDAVITRNWAEVREIKNGDLKGKMETQAKPYGIEILYVTVGNLSNMRSVRLVTDNREDDQVI